MSENTDESQKIEESKKIEQLDKDITISMNICRGVIQRYIAHLEGKDAKDMFPNGVQESNSMGFQFTDGSQAYLKLDLVDWRTYKFDLGKFNCLPVKQAMASTINNLKPVFDYVIANDIDAEETPSYLLDPFNIVPDPNTNIFIFNPSTDPLKNLKNLKLMHDTFPLRIGFVWTLQNSTN